MLTAPSSNVINFADHLEDEVKPKPKAQWGKAGCSDWLAAIGDKLSPAEFKALFYLTRHADQYSGRVGDPVKGISAAGLSYLSGMEERYLERSLDAVTKRGFLEKTPGKRGRGHAAKYRLLSISEMWFSSPDDENADN